MHLAGKKGCAICQNDVVVVVYVSAVSCGAVAECVNSNQKKKKCEMLKSMKVWSSGLLGYCYTVTLSRFSLVCSSDRQTDRQTAVSKQVLSVKCSEIWNSTAAVTHVCILYVFIYLLFCISLYYFVYFLSGLHCFTLSYGLLKFLFIVFEMKGSLLAKSGIFTLIHVQ